MKRPSRLIVCFALLASALVPSVASAAPGSVTVFSKANLARHSAYALDTATVAAHPEWILKDVFGNRVYLGTAVAADFGNPAYRAWWIAQVAGQRGVYVDDVTMERRVYTSFGTLTNPRDPRTGGTMSEATWQ